MISFRYHVVSIIAVFLALALGIVVGTTALNGPVTTDLRRQVNSLKTDRSNLANQVKTLQNQLDDAGQFASQFGTQLIQGTLKGQTLLLITLPGASEGMHDGISAQLTAAGAQISGDLKISQNYVDPTQSQSILGLATGPSHPIGVSLPATSDPGLVGGALLADVLLGKGQATDLSTVLSGFAGLHMINSDPKSIQPAKTVVVIGSGSQPKNTYAGQNELDLVAALAADGGNVVVAGDSGSATGNGIVALVRASPSRATVSTVDDADLAFGQVSTALAVAGILQTQVGQYGTGKGASALFPTPTG